ncbi:MAG: TetR/AcrR family transcriptional regulator [Clostridia bacterium]|nr:TetR/AcrR family transcriptional regulator [Clostridia bacterium]
MINENKRRLNHTDRRVKRTRKALKDALFELLETKNINQITVTELTSLADVNRATFYFYYTDLHDMLKQIQSEAYQTFEHILDEATGSFSTVEGFAEYANKMLIVCKENESLCRFIIKHDGDNHLYQQIRYLMLKKIPDTRAVFPEDNPARYSTNFVLTAVTGVLIDWMNDGMKIPTEELAYFFANLYINGAAKTKDIYLNYQPPEK